MSGSQSPVKISSISKIRKKLLQALSEKDRNEYSSLQRLRKDYEIRIYEGVRQGFANENADNYDAAAAGDAWNRTLDFLQRHLPNEPAEADAS